MFKRKWRELITVYLLLIIGSLGLNEITVSHEMGLHKYVLSLTFFSFVSAACKVYFGEEWILSKLFFLYSIGVAGFSYYLGLAIIPAILTTEFLEHHIFDENGSFRSVFCGVVFALLTLILSLIYSRVFIMKGRFNEITIHETINVILSTGVFALIGAIAGDILGIRIKIARGEKGD